MIEAQDTVLVRQCLKGNLAAFEKLVDKYEKVIFNIAYRMLNDVQESEDITQSVFIKAYENLENYNEKYKFYSWIYRIAVNETLNQIKKNKRMNKVNINETMDIQDRDEDSRESEMSGQMQAALMKITPEQRSLIMLKHVEDCSYLEISQILNIPEKKVKSRLYDARQQLKRFFIQDGLVSHG